MTGNRRLVGMVGAVRCSGERVRREVSGLGWGYDGPEQPGDQHVATAVHWKEMGQKLPLTSEELRAIADNVAPYMQ